MLPAVEIAPEMTEPISIALSTVPKAQTISPFMPSRTWTSSAVARSTRRRMRPAI